MRTLSFIAIAICGTAVAQDQFEIGARAGLNYHFQSTRVGQHAPAGAEAPRAYDGPGYHVGAFAQFAISPRWTFRPELLYSTRMTSERSNSDVMIMGVRTVSERKMRGALSYLEIPLFAGVRMSDKHSVQAGPGIGVLLANRSHVSGATSVTEGGNTTSTTVDTKVSSTEGLRSVELAAVVDMHYRLGTAFDLGFRYWQGLTTLEKNVDLVRTHQRMLQLTVGYVLVSK